MAQNVECWPCKPKDLNSVLQKSHKKIGMKVCVPVVPALIIRKADTGNPNQPGQHGKGPGQ